MLVVTSRPALSVPRAMLSPSPPVMMALESFKEEHLVWGPQFGVRFAGSLLLCGVLLLGAQQHPPSHASLQRLLHRLSSSLSSAPAWTTLGLLSSSCCAAQLVLNTFSIGCAGFNTLLGPLRPLLLAVTCTLQLCVLRAALASHSALLSVLPVSGLTATLALMPELLHAATSGGKATRCDMRLQVDGMGCTACTVGVKRALERMPEVTSASVDLASASACVRLADGLDEPADRLELERRMARELTKAGFAQKGAALE